MRRRLVSASPGIFNLVGDWAVHMPFFYLPVFYCVREAATRPELGASAVSSGLANYRENAARPDRVRITQREPRYR
jgi:hypothetical protein